MIKENKQETDDEGKLELATVASASPLRMVIWAPSSELVSSSISSSQILTAHAQPFRGARDLAFCLKVPLDSLLIWTGSGGSGETARMRRLAWTFAARICDKYQIRLTRSIYKLDVLSLFNTHETLALGSAVVKNRHVIQPAGELTTQKSIHIQHRDEIKMSTRQQNQHWKSGANEIHQWNTDGPD